MSWLAISRVIICVLVEEDNAVEPDASSGPGERVAGVFCKREVVSAEEGIDGLDPAGAGCISDDLCVVMAFGG